MAATTIMMVSKVKRFGANDICDFGAVESATPAANAAAIQSALDAASAKGGGTVVVPAGTFVSGTIWLRPHV